MGVFYVFNEQLASVRDAQNRLRMLVVHDGRHSGARRLHRWRIDDRHGNGGRMRLVSRLLLLLLAVCRVHLVRLLLLVQVMRLMVMVRLIRMQQLRFISDDSVHQSYVGRGGGI